MAVKIRLKRLGKIRAPYYRIIVIDAHTKRDGRAIEEIGKYAPKEDPSYIQVNSERAQHWLSVGAQPTEPVQAILRKTGDWQRFKGEPLPEPLKVAEAAPDKKAIFEEAAREAQAETEQDKQQKKAKKSEGKKSAGQPPAAAEATETAPEQTSEQTADTESGGAAGEAPSEEQAESAQSEG